MVDQTVLNAFQTMWGPFPEPVMLIHRNRTILAVNDFAREAGVPAGVKCYSLNPANGPDADHCKRCKAKEALTSGKAVCSEEKVGDIQVLGYWMPLKENGDVYVHFGIGTAEAMLKQKAQSSSQLPVID